MDKEIWFEERREDWDGDNVYGSRNCINRKMGKEKEEFRLKYKKLERIRKVEGERI